MKVFITRTNDWGGNVFRQVLMLNTRKDNECYCGEILTRFDVSRGDEFRKQMSRCAAVKV